MLSKIQEWIEDRWPVKEVWKIATEEEIPGGASYSYTFGEEHFLRAPLSKRRDRARIYKLAELYSQRLAYQRIEKGDGKDETRESRNYAGS